MTQTITGVGLSQQRYLKDLLKRKAMNTCNATRTPMAANAHILPAQPDEEPLSIKNHFAYRRHVGELLYLATSTRPDISFAVCTLARSLHAPTDRHELMVRRFQRYLPGSAACGIVFFLDAPRTGLQAYSDAGWARCQETRQSTTGSVFYYQQHRYSLEKPTTADSRAFVC